MRFSCDNVTVASPMLETHFSSFSWLSCHKNWLKTSILTSFYEKVFLYRKLRNVSRIIIGMRMSLKENTWKFYSFTNKNDIWKKSEISRRDTIWHTIYIPKGWYIGGSIYTKVTLWIHHLFEYWEKFDFKYFCFEILSKKKTKKTCYYVKK